MCMSSNKDYETPMGKANAKYNNAIITIHKDMPDIKYSEDKYENRLNA